MHLDTEILAEVSQLARDKTWRGRQALAACLRALLSGNQAASARSTVLAVIHELMSAMGDSDRDLIMANLFDQSVPDLSLVGQFLTGPTLVRQAAVRAAPQLAPEHLDQVLRSGDPADRVALARRPDLTPERVARLIVTQEEAVVEALLLNLAVTLRADVVERLGHMAVTRATIQRALIARPEVTRDQAVRLYWWLGPEARDLATGRFALDLATLHGSLIDQFAQLAQLARARGERAVRDLAADVHEAGAVDDRVLGQAIASGHLPLVAEILRLATKLPPAAVTVLTTPGGEQCMVVVGRALGLSRDITLAAAEMAGGPSRNGARAALEERWAALDPVAARALLARWIRNPKMMEQGLGLTG